MLRNPEYYEAAIYVMLGYFLSWPPSEIDKMDFDTLMKCMEILEAMMKEGVSKAEVELMKGKIKG
ncbi:MAG: hypothetical protein QXF58_04225 [Desulfurococcaceae archaeon]